jgi:phosphoenolpyruvate carboxykinase (GTP)
VPISAILFGGRRATNVPLVTQSFDWQQGTFLGAVMSSEKTAAAAGTVGEVRFDPFAMLPFMGYNVGDYIQHWLDIGGATDADKLPKLFWVNWFRKSDEGQFLWPGFGENSRVLKWALERIAGTADATETPIGWVPTAESLDTDGLDLDADTLGQLLEVDPIAWKGEVERIGNHFDAIGERLPAKMREELSALEQRLGG